MKRFLFLLLSAILFFACGPDTGGGGGTTTTPEKDTTAYQVAKDATSSYLGDFDGATDQHFWVVMTVGEYEFVKDADGVWTGATEGEGQQVRIEYYSATADNITPATGKYVVDDLGEKGIEGYMVKGDTAMVDIFGMGYLCVVEGCHIFDIADGGIDTVYAESGWMTYEGTPENAVIKTVMTMDDGSTRAFKYEGKMELFDGRSDKPSDDNQGGDDPEQPNPDEGYNYDKEPAEAKTLNMQFGWGEAKLKVSTEAGSEVDRFDLYMDQDTGDWYAEIDLFVPKGTKKADGVYEVSKTGLANTCQYSRGAKDGKHMRSYISNGKDYYYFTEGTVTVSGEDVTIDVKTKNGSTIKATLKGALEY